MQSNAAYHVATTWNDLLKYTYFWKECPPVKCPYFYFAALPKSLTKCSSMCPKTSIVLHLSPWLSKKKLLRRNDVIFPKALSLRFTHLVSVVYNYLLSSATRIPFLVLWCLLVDIRRMGTWFISPVLPFFPFVHWRPSCLLTFVRLLYNVLFKAGFDDNEQFFTMFAYRETRKNSDNLEATKSFGILSRPTASFSSLDD